jgi:hypothetical protein
MVFTQKLYVQIAIDHHSPIHVLMPNQCYLSDPPHFLLPSTVGGHVIAYFAEKYGSENYKFLTTQTTYEVTAAFICISEGGG